MEKAIALFEGKRIRKVWDDKAEKWYFSVVDVVAALTESENPRDYWSRMKIREKEGSGIELSTFCLQLKLESSDGKRYETDCADTEGMFRIIQSIPSKNAEHFKIWLAKVGQERIEETHDPELAINRALQTYLKKGYSMSWINQRLKAIEIRKDLTDEWEKRGIKNPLDFALLTDEISFAWAGLTTKQYKKFKELKKENLRDNMTNLELVLNMLAEASTAEISKETAPDTMEKHAKVAQKGGGVAKAARQTLEKETGKSVISKTKHDPEKIKRLK